MAHDLSGKTDREIRNWVANHEKQGVTDTDLYRELLGEYARRTGRGLNADTSLAHLMNAAKTGKFTTYGDLAKASDVPWSKARHAMNGPLGHLDQLLSICHSRGLNSPEISRHPRFSFSVAVRSRRATASRFMPSSAPVIAIFIQPNSSTGVSSLT